MSSRNIQALVDDIRHTVSVTSLNFDIWWIYKSKDSRPKYTKTMNRYGLFFQTSIHAHFVAILVALYRLYETRPGVHSIPNLLKELGSGAVLPKAALDNVKHQYQAAKPLWVKVSILRNEAFGHLPSGRTVADAFKKAGITANNLRDLVKQTKQLINRVTHELDRSGHAFNLSATHDTLSMLEDLRTRWP